MVSSLKCAPWVRVVVGLLAGWAGTSHAAPLEGSPIGERIAAAELAIHSPDLARGNQLVTISSGYDALLLRVHLIRQARSSIAIQTFIWTNDECGRLLICELIEAARRGV